MDDIINKHYKEFLAFCYKLTKNKDDAEDLLHDVVIKLYSKKERYNNINKSFIYVVIKNYFIDEKRKNKNIVDLELIDERLVVDVSEDDFLRCINEASNCLSFLEYGLLTANESMRKISRDSGVSVRKIKTIVDNAKIKLKKKWQEVENQKDLEM